jgi:CrcB protein
MQGSVVLAVAAAGSVGAVARWWLAEQLNARWPELPFATAVVNVLGCLGYGFVAALAAGRWPPAVVAGALAGFFGAFTTFSTFAHDCHDLLARGRLGWFALDVVGQNALGLLAMALGLRLGALLRGEAG